MTAGTDILVVPQTGELLDLATLADDELAELALTFRAVERDVIQARKRTEHALMDRMRQHDRKIEHTASGYRFEIHGGRSRVWDPDDLEAAVRHLHDEGVINASQYTGLIRREVKVDGNRARDLLGALTGTARRTIEACFTWKDREPTIEIKPPRPPAIEATADEDA
jgi:hypothetical protein